jgi:hypothetical protein
MSWSYRFQAFPTTSIVTLTYQFVYQERDHEAFQPLVLDISIPPQNFPLILTAREMLFSRLPKRENVLLF